MRVLICAILLTAAACVNMKASLAERATFDLGCSVKESEITEIASGQYGVTACGCRATYVSYPGWTLNSVSGEACRSQGPAAAGSPKAP
ncbi:MAG: hypothetical protein IAE78_12840 [Myxococcus sp.]|nr:hypothetical protein [Myxococcus sp.]